MTSSHPATPQPRLIVPDLARGLALAGIATANAVQAWMLNDYDAPGTPGWTLGGIRPGSVVDQLAAVFSAMFVHVRGLPMFSTLLGVGIGFIVASMHRKGYPQKQARAALIRRYGFLALFGFAHLFLLFYGDIMSTYGIIGMLVGLMFTLSTRRLRQIAYIALGVTGVFSVFGAVSAYFFGMPDMAEAGLNAPEQASLGAYFANNAGQALWMLASIPFAALQLMGLVLIGFIWAREGYLVNVDAHRRTLMAWVCIGAAVVVLIGLPWGLAGIGVLDPALEAPLYILNGYFGMFTGPAILAALALATGGVQRRMFEEAAATGSAHAPAWASPFVALGKRSMSGYLAQSFLFPLLVMPFALGWGLEASISMKLLVGLVVWLITLALAVVLEATGTPGPFEQLHRRLSYGKTKRLEPYTPSQ